MEQYIRVYVHYLMLQLYLVIELQYYIPTLGGVENESVCTVDHCTLIYHRRNPIDECFKLINQEKRTEAYYLEK